MSNSLNEFADQESRLEACIQGNNTEEAIRIISELAITCARQKQFDKAEHYRDRLYDVDETALTDIIRVNEIIEKEKSQGIDVSHRQLFAILYERLSPDQANTLFYALEEMDVSAGTVVCRQGELSNSLFFVSSGKLSIGYKQDNHNSFLGFLEPGAFFGEDTFFSNSISTVSITAYSPTKLYKLGKETFKRLRDEHPGLQGTLRNYCFQSGTVSDELKKQGLDRRRLKREKLFGKALMQLFGNTGELIGKPLRIELHDISTGGTSFLLRISDEEKAELMLGRKLVIQFSSKNASPPVKIQKRGTIVAISPSSFDDHSFHVKFDSELMPRFLETILSAFKDGER